MSNYNNNQNYTLSKTLVSFKKNLRTSLLFAGFPFLTIKVEIISKKREVAILSPNNVPSTFEFFYCATEKFKC